MNRCLKSIITVFLGVMILAAGSGVSLAKMVCIKSGNITFTTNVPDDCCKHEHEHERFNFEEKCCDISSMHIAALQYLTSSSQNIQKSFVAVEVLSPLSAFGYAQFDNSVSNQARRFSLPIESSSPPIRILTRTFIV